MAEEKILINYLKESIDRLADKFDSFTKCMAERDIAQRVLETQVADHTTRLTSLETPNQKKLQDRYPIVYKLCETCVLIGLTVIAMKLFPTVGKVLTSTLG